MKENTDKFAENFNIFYVHKTNKLKIEWQEKNICNRWIPKPIKRQISQWKMGES